MLNITIIIVKSTYDSLSVALNTRKDFDNSIVKYVTHIVSITKNGKETNNNEY
jgi:hypothetical protein